MARIQSLNMSTMDVFVALADGNPGAIKAMLDIFENAEKVDPDAMLGGLGAVLSLDTHQIYGPRIWMLYKDVCDGDVVKVLALLRGVQLGLMPVSTLNTAIDNRGQGVDVSDVLARVRQRLPAFAPDTSGESR